MQVKSTCAHTHTHHYSTLYQQRGPQGGAMRTTPQITPPPPPLSACITNTLANKWDQLSVPTLYLDSASSIRKQENLEWQEQEWEWNKSFLFNQQTKKNCSSQCKVLLSIRAQKFLALHIHLRDRRVGTHSAKGDKW